MTSRALLTLAALTALCGTATADTTQKVSLNRSSIQITDRTYATGVSTSLDGTHTHDFSKSKKVSLAGSAFVSYGSFTAEREEVTETDTIIDASLEARMKVLERGGYTLHANLGGDFAYDGHTVTVVGTRGYFNKTGFGPRLGMSLGTPFGNAALSASHLFGTRATSYDVTRNTMQQDVELSLTPQIWKLRLPTTLIAYHNAITNQAVDRHEFSVRVQAMPTFMVTKNVGIGLNIEYTNMLEGSDEFSRLDVGGGVYVTY